MRKRRGYTRRVFRVLRITPAYAGNTVKGIKALREQEDHPRVFGKYPIRTKLRKYDTGSPPRMREIQTFQQEHFVGFGITPAYAGNTYSKYSLIENTRDHPRVCGKYLTRLFPTVVLAGSPPRMREIPIRFHCIADFLRITPAYAGNTHRKEEFSRL